MQEKFDLKRFIGVITLLHWTFLVASAQSTADATAWGDAVEGVQLHLRVAAESSNAPPPTAIELPRFEVQLRNQGSRAITFIPQALNQFVNIEIDGVWYGVGSAGSCCAAQQELAPGQQSAVFTSGFRNNLIWEMGPNNSSNGELRLKPGRHTIRFRSATGNYSVTVQTSPPHGIVLVSNRITVDIPEVAAAVERQALVDTVSKGNLPGQTTRTLIDKYPEAALGAIEAGIRAANSGFVQGNMISWLGYLHGDDVTAFLKSKLAISENFPSRAAAAEVLFRHGDPLALPAALAVWRDIQPILRMQPVANNGLNFAAQDTPFAVGSLISILSQSGDVNAIDTLGREARQDPIDVRLAALRAFLPTAKGGSVTTGSQISLNGVLEDLPGGAAGAAVEHLLAAALDDKDQRRDLRGTFNGFSYENPRVCDIAALVFFLRWPEKYPFHWSMDVTERDTQIDAIRKAVRQ